MPFSMFFSRRGKQFAPRVNTVSLAPKSSTGVSMYLRTLSSFVCCKATAIARNLVKYGLSHSQSLKDERDTLSS